MMTTEQTTSFSRSLLPDRTTFGAAPLLAGALVIVGCDSNEVADEPQIEALVISLSGAYSEVGEQVNVSTEALTASADTVGDVDRARVSTNSAVFTVGNNGHATGQSARTADCVVGVSDNAAIDGIRRKAIQRPFDGLGPAFDSVLGG